MSLGWGEGAQMKLRQAGSSPVGSPQLSAMAPPCFWGGREMNDMIARDEVMAVWEGKQREIAGLRAERDALRADIAWIERMSKERAWPSLGAFILAFHAQRINRARVGAGKEER